MVSDYGTSDSGNDIGGSRSIVVVIVGECVMKVMMMIIMALLLLLGVGGSVGSWCRL